MNGELLLRQFNFHFLYRNDVRKQGIKTFTAISYIIVSSGLKLSKESGRIHVVEEKTVITIECFDRSAFLRSEIHSFMNLNLIVEGFLISVGFQTLIDPTSLVLIVIDSCDYANHKVQCNNTNDEANDHFNHCERTF
jgi:hypothetical protein